MARFVNRKVIMDSRKYTVEYIPEFADCDKKYDIKPQVLLAWCAELAGNHLRSRNITRERRNLYLHFLHRLNKSYLAEEKAGEE